MTLTLADCYRVMVLAWSERREAAARACCEAILDALAAGVDRPDWLTRERMTNVLAVAVRTGVGGLDTWTVRQER